MRRRVTSDDVKAEQVLILSLSCNAHSVYSNCSKFSQDIQGDTCYMADTLVTLPSTQTPCGDPCTGYY